MAWALGGLLCACSSSLTLPDAGRPDGAALPPPTEAPFAACGHLGTGGAMAVAWSPDGRSLAVGSGGGYVTILDAATGDLRRLLELGTSFVGSVAFSPDGALVAGGAYEGEVALWSVADGALRYRVTVDVQVVGLAFAPDGRALVVGGGTKVTLLRSPPGVPVGPPEVIVLDGAKAEGAGGAARTVAISPDGGLLAAASYSSLRLWRLADGGLARTLVDLQPVVAVAFSPDGSAIAGLGLDWLRIWRVSDGALLGSLAASALARYPADRARALAFTPDGDSVVVGTATGVTRFRARAAGAWLPAPAQVARQKAVIGGDLDVARSGRVVYADGGQRLFTWGAERDDDAARLDAEADGTAALALSPDGELLVTASSIESAVRVFRPREGRALWTARDLPLMALSPDGATVALAGAKAPVELRDAPSGVARGSLVTSVTTAQAIAFLAGQPRLAVAATDVAGVHAAVRFLDLPGGGEALPAMDPGLRAVRGMRWSPDGRLVVLHGDDGHLGVTRVLGRDPAARYLGSLGGVEIGDAAFSPDGGALLTSTARDRGPRLFRTSDFVELATVEPGAGGCGGVAFTPDGHSLLVGSGDALVVARLADGAVLQALRGLGRTPVARVAASADNRVVAVAHGDRSVALWCRQ